MLTLHRRAIRPDDQVRQTHAPITVPLAAYLAEDADDIRARRLGGGDFKLLGDEGRGIRAQDRGFSGSRSNEQRFRQVPFRLPSPRHVPSLFTDRGESTPILGERA